MKSILTYTAYKQETIMPLMTTADTPADDTTRELEDVLHISQTILRILAEFDERLGSMKARLIGESPMVSAVEVATDMEPGIIGQLRGTNNVIHTRCASIREWITSLEQVI